MELSGMRLGGKYEIQGELGRGGMGIVYQAYDVMLRRVVAIKLLSPQLLADPGFVQRFRHEAVAVANLRHPNIITIFDVGEDRNPQPPNDPLHYIVMEYIEGQTLDKWLTNNRKPMGVGDVDHIVGQVAQALQYAHDRGVIHRDIKPSNIMIDGEGRAKLMDFGLVRAGELSRLTRSGTVLGTPQYMAPEQITGQDLDARTDIYSLGVVIYELLIGEMPFVRTTPMATAYAHVNDLPPPLREKRPDMLKSVEAVVMKALAKDPAARYQSASQLARDFAVAATGAMPVGLKEYTPPQQVEQTMPMSRPITPPRAATPAPAPRLATPPPIDAVAPPPAPATAKPKRGGLIIAAAAVLLALALGAAAGVLATRNSAPSATPSAATPAAANTPAPAPTTAAAAGEASEEEAAANAAAQAALTSELEAAQTAVTELEATLRSVNGQKLAFASENVLPENQELAALLAIEAAGRNDSNETTNTLRLALTQPANAAAVLGGHSDAVQTSGWNRDGSLAATASADGTVRIWDGVTGALLETFTGHEAAVNRLDWQPSGQRLATADADGKVILWDLELGSALRTINAHAGSVRDLKWDNEGRRLATAGSDDMARIWDVASGQMLTELAGHEGNVLAVEWSPDGSRIATSSEDDTARVWDASDGSLITTLAGHTNFVFHAHWNADGTRILTAGRDSQARVWDAANGDLLLTLEGHTEPVFNAEWSPNERRILTGSRDGLAKIWDAATGEELQSLAGHVGSVNNIDWSPDGALVATAGADGMARLWYAGSGQLFATLTGHTGQIGNVSWNADGVRLLTQSQDATGRIWSLLNSGVLLDRAAAGVPLTHVAWSTAGPDDPEGLLLASAARDGSVNVWDTQSGVLRQRLVGHSGVVNYAAWQPAAGTNEGAWLVTVGQDGARVWDTTTGQQVSFFEGHGEADITYAEWSPDGEQVATASRDGVVHLWDPSTGQSIHNLVGHEDRVLLVRWSPDGSRVITGSSDSTARIWDVETGVELLSLPSETGGRIIAAAWSPDGQRVATGGSDRSGARVWDAQTGEELAFLDAHQVDVVALGWNADESLFMTGSLDNTLRVWDGDTLEELRVLAGHQDGLNSAEWSPDGTMILSGSSDRSARVWDAASGRTIAVLTGPAGEVVNAVWSVDGGRIALAAADGTARSYWLYADDLMAGACQQAPRNMSAGEWEQYVRIDPYQVTCEGKPVPGEDFSQLGIDGS